MRERGMASISELPEGCISDILSLTSPRDACTASAISLGFKSAADSDAVWERFLPSDYQEIIARSDSPVVYDTKKQLYFQLCDSPILIDGGKMLFKLNKSSGKKCYLMRARELSIAWMDDTQYWVWAPIPESRFSEVALLSFVCWLDIRGKVETQMLSRETTYAAYLVFKCGGSAIGLDVPAKTSVKILGETELAVEAENYNAFLQPPSPSRIQQNDRVSMNRMDGWMEIELGDFYNDQGDDSQVEMQLKETDDLNCKSGLTIEGIELRPKE